MANTPTPAQQTAGHTATHSPSDERVAELLDESSAEFDTAAKGEDHFACAFWGPMKDALRDLQALRKREAALQAENERLLASINSALDALDKCHALSDDHEAKEILRAALTPAQEAQT